MNMQRKMKCAVWLCAVMLVLGTIGCGDVPVVETEADKTVSDETRSGEETDVEIPTSGELPDDDTVDEGTDDEDRSAEEISSLLPESPYDMVEKAWLSLLKHEIISLGESGEVWDGARDREYHCSYGIYGGEVMKIIDADVKVAMEGDLLCVNEANYSTRRDAADFLLQTALQRAGELYLEQTELTFSEMTQQEPIRFCLYVIEMDPDETEPMGIIVIDVENMLPMELTIGGMILSHLNEYTANTSSERIFEGKLEEQKPVLTVEWE